jgi:UDP-2,3-diacylglucosamine hydrolase
MGKVYFISDAHLGLGPKAEEREKETRILRWLDHVKPDAAQIYIVGDLFDAWFEYRTVVPKGFYRLFTKLEELTAAGIGIHYLAGNHDFWMRDFFSEELHVRTYRDPIAVTINRKKVCIHHGDGLAANDTGYRILKKVLRSRVNTWLYRWVHPDIGLALARSSSQKSRNHTAGKDYGEHDGMVEFARKKIAEGFDIVVMGHRHSPVRLELGSGVYVNLGDWISHNTYAEMDDGSIALKEWK